MKIKLLLLCFLIPFLYGCKKQSQTYTIQSRTIMNNRWARIEQLFIEGKGSHGVVLGEHFPHISHPGDSLARIGIRKGNDNDLFQAEILIVATLYPGQEFIWYSTVYKLEGDRRVSGGAGSPEILRLDGSNINAPNRKLTDFFEMKNISGTYEYGEPIYIGRFLKQFRRVTDPNITLIVR